ncbi:MAG: tetratricopeptide repeat protein [Magnetococcales bacterium]|nr:tetratricopeptide repeat protein [Magnetococcales bacterium]
MSPEMRQSFPTGPFLLIALALLTVYHAVPSFPYSGMDDTAFIPGNPQVRNGLSWDGLLWALRGGEPFGLWTPLVWLSFMAEVSVFGLSPFIHHLDNLLLHLANVFLFARLLHRLGQSSRVVLTAAALFALHPIHVESVVWIAERKDLLFLFFSLLTLLAHCRGERLTTLLFFFLATTAKPMAITLPILLLLLDYGLLGRAASGFWPLLRQKALLFLLALLVAVATFLLHEAQGNLADTRILPLWARFDNALVSYLAYPLKLLWPYPLAPNYPHPGTELPLWKPLLAAPLLLGLTVPVWKNRERWPFLFTGWFWYLIALLPASGLVQFADQAMADHFLYLPALGLYLAAAGGVDRLLREKPRLTQAVTGVILALLLLLSVLAHRQSLLWSSDEVLFRHTAAVTAPNARALTMLGLSLGNQERWQEALPLLEEAVRLKPRMEQARRLLGRTLLALQHPEEALPHLESAVALGPQSAVNHLMLARAFRQLHRDDAARNHLRRARELKPNLIPPVELAPLLEEAPLMLRRGAP